MTYKATQDVVRRVMPLLERLATRTIDRARLLQYLSARAGADWGALELVAEKFQASHNLVKSLNPAVNWTNVSPFTPIKAPNVTRAAPIFRWWTETRT